MRAYSMDLRQRVLADSDEGLGTAAVAARYGVSPAWVRRLKQRRQATGETAPRTAGRRPPIWAPHAEAIRIAVAEAPDATLTEPLPQLGLSFSIATLARALAAMGMTFKKSRAGRRARSPRRGGPAGRMGRRYGRSPRGRRLVGMAPHRHRKTTTFVAALGATGLVAPMVVDGAINGDLFTAYVELQLVPTLAPGDVVVMDNLSSHKRPKVREAIEGAGCRLILLPPNSPDLNPIELAFAKLKAPLRKAGKRTVEALFWEFLGLAVDAFGPEECRNYLRHCGYVATPP